MDLAALAQANHRSCLNSYTDSADHCRLKFIGTIVSELHNLITLHFPNFVKVSSQFFIVDVKRKLKARFKRLPAEQGAHRQKVYIHLEFHNCLLCIQILAEFNQHFLTPKLSFPVTGNVLNR